MGAIRLMVLTLLLAIATSGVAQTQGVSVRATNGQSFTASHALPSLEVHGDSGFPALQVDSILYGPNQATRFSWDLVQGTLDNNGVGTLDMNARTLNNHLDDATVDFDNEQLLDQPASLTSVDWGVRNLFDTANTLSVDWGAHLLWQTLPNQASVDWQNDVLTGASGSSLQWSSCVLDDFTGTVSENWNTRVLEDTTGSLALNYSTRILVNSTAVTVLNWNTTLTAPKGIATTLPDTPVAVAVGASPFTFQNLTPVNEEVYIAGGTVTQIQKNNVTIASASANAEYKLGPNSTIKITYTGAPTMLTNAW